MSWNKRSYRPELEILEDRLVPSISSPFPISSSVRDESAPAVARSANGTSVAVWARDDGSGSRDVFAKRYDANAQQIGATLIVSDTPQDEAAPDVSMDAQGNFVVVWTEVSQNGTDVYYQLFSNAGTSLGSGAVASSSASENDAHVAMNAVGKFAVSYTSQDGIFNTVDILARRFDAQGNVLGGTLKVAARSDLEEFASRIDRADGGRFAISYLQRDPLNGSVGSLVLKRFRGDGSLLSKNRIAKIAGTPVNGVSHDVEMDNASNCVVVFDKNVDASHRRIVQRRVQQDGVLLTAKPLSSISHNEMDPQVAVNRENGKFVVASTRNDAGSFRVIVYECSKTGAVQGASIIGADSLAAAISIDALNRYFVVYESVFSATDTDIKGVFGSPNP